MQLKDIIQGLAVGYIAKAIQLIIAVCMLPFILLSNNLGTNGYGVAYSLLTAVFAYNLLTDGIRTACAKRIAKSVDDGQTGIVVGESVRIFIFTGFIYSIVIFTMPNLFLSLLGIDNTSDNLSAARIVALIVFISSLSISFNSLLFSTGKIATVNIINIGSLIFKNLYYLICFTYLNNNVTIFVSGILLSESLILCFYLLYVHKILKQYLVGFFTINVLLNPIIIKDAFSLGLVSVYSILFLRFSVPVVNRYLGSEAAGLMSIVLNVADNYLRQILSSIIRPTIVPIISRIDLKLLSTKRRELMWELDAVYSTICIVSLNTLNSVVPIIIPLWLGSSYTEIILSAQLMILSITCQLTSLFKRGFVISENHAAKIVPYSSLFALISFTLFLYGVLELHSWKVALLVVSVFMILHTTASIGLVFYKHVLNRVERSERKQEKLIFALISVFAITTALSQIQTSNITGVLILVSIATGVSLVISHIFVIKYDRLIYVVSTLRGNYSSRLF